MGNTSALFHFSRTQLLLPSCKCWYKICIISEAFLFAKSSEIKNPLSARTWSPCSSLSKKPLLCVITLSEVLPLNALETKDMAPVGVTETKNLIVLLCL